MSRPYLLYPVMFDGGPPLDDRQARMQRHVADRCHELDDRVLWHLVTDDLTHLRIIDSTHREFRGGKFQTIPKPTSQASLFDQEGAA